MRKIRVLNQKPFVYIFALILVFVLTACGAHSGTTVGSNGEHNPASPPTPTTAIIAGYGTANGCPSNAVVSSPPSKADVIVQTPQAQASIAAHTGNSIEVRLPFGQKWMGPLHSQGVLELQTPSGYADKTDHMCVWRFVSKGTGTTQLTFSGEALCKPRQMCPMYIRNIPITITIK